eukprot:snap_masked-scaffold_40-processed-gene-0.34-mRNA-1 protein AED:1.00 eAED:1.00 QI:0/0/0/0/1/1/2/0/61
MTYNYLLRKLSNTEKNRLPRGLTVIIPTHFVDYSLKQPESAVTTGLLPTMDKTYQKKTMKQ